MKTLIFVLLIVYAIQFFAINRNSGFRWVNLFFIAAHTLQLAVT